VPVGGRLRGGGSARARSRPAAQHPGPPGQPDRVDDHRHSAVAQDRRPGEHARPARLLGQRLHHDLLGVVDGIDRQPEPPVVRLHHHHAQRPVGGRDRLDLQLAGQRHQRHEAAAEAEHRRPVQRLDRRAARSASNRTSSTSGPCGIA
jgi:hypothetical protein